MVVNRYDLMGERWRDVLSARLVRVGEADIRHLTFFTDGAGLV